MKKILVPTDFSETSIRLLNQLSKTTDQETELLFTHLFYLPEGIPDLLFSTYRLREYKFVTPEFKNAYLEFYESRNQKKSEHMIPIRFFYGNTLIYFKNFLQANQIDLIAYSDKYPVKKLNSSSIEINSVIRKCGTELLNIDERSTTPKI